MTILGGDKNRMITLPWLDEELATSYEHLLKLSGLK